MHSRASESDIDPGCAAGPSTRRPGPATAGRRRGGGLAPSTPIRPQQRLDQIEQQIKDLRAVPGRESAARSTSSVRQAGPVAHPDRRRRVPARRGRWPARRLGGTTTATPGRARLSGQCHRRACVRAECIVSWAAQSHQGRPPAQGDRHLPSTGAPARSRSPRKAWAIQAIEQPARPRRPRQDRRPAGEVAHPGAAPGHRGPGLTPGRSRHRHPAHGRRPATTSAWTSTPCSRRCPRTMTNWGRVGPPAAPTPAWR